MITAHLSRCKGKQYVEALKRAPRYDLKKFGLSQRSQGKPIFIFLEGSSFMGELAASIICENDMEGWTLDGLNSNSMLGKVRNEEIYVFVLSNHFAFNGNLIATIGLLKKVHFHVTGALLGSFNSGKTNPSTPFCNFSELHSHFFS